MMRLLLALVIGGMLGLAAQPVWACDPVWLPIARPQGIAFFVATASGAVPGGQLAELQLAGGSATAPRQGPVILVPWEYGPIAALFRGTPIGRGDCQGQRRSTPGSSGRGTTGSAVYRP